MSESADPPPDPPAEDYPQYAVDPGYDYYGQQAMPYGAAPAGHSRLGIASTIIGAIAVLIGLIGIILAVMNLEQINAINQMEPTEIPPDILKVILLIAAPVCMGMFLALAGFILGIVGLTQNGTSKIFPIIGTCLNGLMLGTCAVNVLLSLLLK